MLVGFLTGKGSKGVVTEGVGEVQKHLVRRILVLGDGWGVGSWETTERTNSNRDLNSRGRKYS